ncbi:GlxA family transcriptional regulator [Raoultella sp. WB_B2P2-3]|uniref:GlxA family transcriptional regulator n=2 Tax=Raoultella scottii TaxID=3040937 RepID=A0ABU8YZX4_9ENTR
MAEDLRHNNPPTFGFLDDQAEAPLSAVSPATAELSVGVMLWPQFPLLSLSGFIDALRHAADTGDKSRQMRCQWKILGLPGQRILSSCGIEVAVNSEFMDPKQYDYIVVIGGLLESIDTAPKAYSLFLHHAAVSGVPLIGLCTGSFVLARHGLMEGRTACVHAYHSEDWRHRFPGLRFINTRDFLIDRDRITCAGGVSVIELAIHLIGMHCGADRASKVIHQITVAKKSTGSYADRRKALGYASFTNRHLHEAVMLMEKYMMDPLDIGTIAQMVGTSKRQLERIFYAETKTPPAQFYRQIRLRFGRWLLISSTLTLAEIAFECGFADAPHFIRNFQKMFGTSPGKLRCPQN